jgi:hypothetical protein
MTNALQAADVLAATIPTGIAIKDAVLVLAGNVFIIIFIIRSVGSWAKKEWGELIVNMLAAVVIGGLVYFTADAVEMLKAVWTLVVG